VDRAFFKIERQVEQTLRFVQAELDAATDNHDLVERLQQGVEGTLHLDQCLVVAADGPEIVAAGGKDPADADQWWREISAAEVPFLGLPTVLEETSGALEKLPVLLAEAGFKSYPFSWPKPGSWRYSR